MSVTQQLRQREPGLGSPVAVAQAWPSEGGASASSVTPSPPAPDLFPFAVLVSRFEDFNGK